MTDDRVEHMDEDGPDDMAEHRNDDVGESGSARTSRDDSTSGLTHLDSRGRPRMVDVSDKDVTSREAVAVGRIRMSAEALEAIRKGRTAKGDVLKVAELAGIMAGKRTGEVIPLCHVLPAVSLTVELEPDPDLPGIRCRALARIAGQTGVEMEALTAASVALLTVYDMVKSLDRAMSIEEVALTRKSGGRSGTWTAEREGGIIRAGSHPLRRPRTPGPAGRHGRDLPAGTATGPGSAPRRRDGSRPSGQFH